MKRAVTLAVLKLLREISAFQFMRDFPKLYIFLFTLKNVKEFASILQLIMPQLGETPDSSENLRFWYFFKFLKPILLQELWNSGRRSRIEIPSKDPSIICRYFSAL